VDSLFEPFEAGGLADPYRAYRRLRDEAPVYFAPRSRVWCVSRHDDVAAVLKDCDAFSSRAMFSVLMNGGSEDGPPISLRSLWMVAQFAWRTGLNPLGFARARNLIASDPPVHDGLRSIVNRGFTPRRVAAWEPRIRGLVGELLAPLRAGAAFDLVHDFAVPLPVTIIAEMLGVERERMRDFKHWSDLVIEGSTGPKRRTAPDPPHPEVWRAMTQLTGYLAGVLEQRRRSPADDLASVLVAEQDGGAALSSLEAASFVTLLLVAGNETTTNLIGNAVQALLDHPEVLARVAEDPRLVPGVVEETLRWNAPIQMVFRKTTRDVELAGTRIPAGAVVAPILGSANRDERRFADPDRFDPARDARGHLGFGFGAHFCLGASLARLEAHAALEALAPALPQLTRREERPPWTSSFLVRGPTRLELVRAA
jgi:cytochrome P450